MSQSLVDRYDDRIAGILSYYDRSDHRDRCPVFAMRMG